MPEPFPGWPRGRRPKRFDTLSSSVARSAPRVKMKFPLAVSLSTLLVALVPAPAAVDFEKDVRPILEIHCVRCHNPKGTDFESGKTDVDLTSHESAFEVASTIVAGNPDKSKLYKTTVLPDDAP